MQHYDAGRKYTPRELGPLLHALLAAAMLCESMKQLQARHGYLEGPQYGIYIDVSRHEVVVEGRSQELYGREFDALAYLYKNAGRVCTRRQIAEEGLGDTGYTGSSHDISRLNTLISRLRKRIEPDPRQNRYILTVPGEGYKLYCPE